MKIHLIALAIATVDAWNLFFIRQAQAVDTSVWIALIAGIVGLLTLIIQTYGQIRLAKISKQQDEIKDKQAIQTDQIKEVHTAVNSERSVMLAKLDAMHEKISLLETAAGVRASEDAAIVADHAGRGAGAAAKVEVVNTSDAPIPTKPIS